MKTQHLIMLTIACTVSAQGAPRTSANYTISPESTDSGGQRSVSASYTHDGSAGLIAGLATVAAPAETAKAGYIGQLFEVTGLTLAATPATIDEGLTRQLAAQAALDDATLLALAPGDVAWSVLTGPLTGIDAAGVATAGLVYQNTPATVQGALGALTGTLDLTVRNVLADNFHEYASDGLDDAWQLQYFGQPPNTNAEPLKDPDGDGQDNQFEFTAGLIPTDPLSRFLLRIEPVAGQPAQKRLVFSPRFNDRTYNILTSTTLLGDSWSALTGSISDNGNQRTVTDPNAGAGKKFYRVQVLKP